MLRFIIDNIASRPKSGFVKIRKLARTRIRTPHFTIQIPDDIYIIYRIYFTRIGQEAMLANVGQEAILAKAQSYRWPRGWHYRILIDAFLFGRFSTV